MNEGVSVVGWAKARAQQIKLIMKKFNDWIAIPKCWARRFSFAQPTNHSSCMFLIVSGSTSPQPFSYQPRSTFLKKVLCGQSLTCST